MEARKYKKHVRSSLTVLTPEDTAIIRELYREHLEYGKKILAVEEQVLDLMEKRDELRSEHWKTCVQEIAAKFEVSKNTINTVVRSRGYGRV